MNPRYYKKKGTTYREVLRCPLCGKLSKVGYFSQDHSFGVYRFGFGGRGKISCQLVDKDPIVMRTLKEGLVGRFLDLLKKFTGERYYSQSEVDLLMNNRYVSNIRIIPPPQPVKAKDIKINEIKVKPNKVIIE